MWQPLATLTLTSQWQYTPVTNAVWFRMRHSANVGFAKGHFGQAYVSLENVDLLNVFSIFPSKEGEIVRLLPIPHAGYLSRQLAVRLTQRSSNLTVPWTISLDSMPISQTEVPNIALPVSNAATETIVPQSSTPVTFLAANPDRKGFSVLNATTAILYLKFTPYGNGVNNAQAIAESTIRIAGNALYECPVTYTGAVYGVFASTSGNARIVEYT